MAIFHIFDNFAAANWAEVAQSPAYNVGTPFTVNRGMFLTKMTWYRKATGATRTPYSLTCWDTISQAPIAQINSVMDDGAVGWQDSALPNPVALVANREYRVAAGFANNDTIARYTLGTPPSPPSPLFFGANYRCYVQSGATTYPNTLAAQFLQAVDVEVDDTGTGDLTPPVTESTALDAVAAYLEGTTNPEGISSVARSTNTTVNTIAGDVADILTSVGSGLGTAVASILATINDATTGMAATNADVNAIGTSILTGDPNSLQAIAGSVGTVLERLGVLPSGSTASFLQAIRAMTDAGRNLDPVPAAAWTMVSETAWTDEFALATPADVYVVTFLTLPLGMATVDVAGVPWNPRLGWWAELNGNQVGERHYIDFTPAGVHRLPERLPGIVFRAQGPCNGTVQAWTRA